MKDHREKHPEHNLLTQFERQALATPDAVALIMGEQRLTYRQVNERANQIGHALRSLGVIPEQLVGICLTRSPEAILAIFGIIKAGAAYVPIDPTYPLDRQRFLVEDANIQILLTDHVEHMNAMRATVPHLLGLHDLSWQMSQRTTNLDIPVANTGLLYVLYTSGSTGKPKGVCGSHFQMRSRLQWLWDAFPAGQSQPKGSEIWCNKTTLHFVDASLEIFGALLQGAPLVILSEAETANAEAMVQLLQQHRVTRLFLVISHLRTLLLAQPKLGEELPALTLWVASGERLTGSLVAGFYAALPNAQLVNLYGCTEVPEISWMTIPADWQADAPIGYPTPNSMVYVVDEHEDGTLHRVAVGDVGELVVHSSLMALRYFQREEETAARFIADPFMPDADPLQGRRIFRTGDRVRQDADGLLHYVGRADHLVKIRGYRVELPEVEAALIRADEKIKATVVVVSEDPLLAENKQLVAFVTPKSVDPTDVRVALQKELPHFMVPEQIIALSEFPLTTSGKINRQALLETVQPIRLSLAPDAPVKEIITQLWRAILQVDEVHSQMNFFKAGGNSLRLAQLSQQLRIFFGDRAPSLTMLLHYSTIEALAQHIDPPPAETIQPEQGETQPQATNRRRTAGQLRARRQPK